MTDLYVSKQTKTKLTVDKKEMWRLHAFSISATTPAHLSQLLLQAQTGWNHSHLCRQTIEKFGCCPRFEPSGQVMFTLWACAGSVRSSCMMQRRLFQRGAEAPGCKVEGSEARGSQEKRRDPAHLPCTTGSKDFGFGMVAPVGEQSYRELQLNHEEASRCPTCWNPFWKSKLFSFQPTNKINFNSTLL